MRKVLIPAAFAALAAVFSSSFAVAAPIVTNGSFETGNRSGWGVNNLGNGNWVVYRNPNAVDGGINPPHGDFAIITQQGDPGSHVLLQRVRLPQHGELRLKFILRYESNAPITTDDSLRHDTGDVNQQFRVDILRRRAPLRTLNPSDILATAFQTEEGDPQFLSKRTVTEDISHLRGRRVRLRFVEVDNDGNFFVIIDRVRIVRA
jgi:hypothetical protein